MSYLLYILYLLYPDLVLNNPRRKELRGARLSLTGEHNLGDITWVDPKSLTPHPKNRNKHPPEQIEALIKIFKYQGLRKPITVSNRSGYIVTGHGTLQACIKMGMKKVPVNKQNFEDETQEILHLNADNGLSQWGVMDFAAINEDTLQLGPFDTDLLGIKDWEPIAEDKYSDQDADAVPETKQNELGVQLGDIYQLGEHRLMCGDSTDLQTVEKLMNGEKVEITFTSPPYNAGITPKENGKYRNDSDDKSSEMYLLFLKSFTSLALTFSNYVFVNIQSISGNKLALIEYLYELKEQYADTLIWNKLSSQPAMANNVLNSQFEYVHVFSHKANRAIGTKVFRGTISNVIDMSSRGDKEFAKEHKATMPVSFAEYFIQNFCKQSVYEPFAGTGTTLIACEKTDRKCFGMELDPHYCSVIIKRWEQFTGKKAVKLNG